MVQQNNSNHEIVIDTNEADSVFSVIKRGLFSLWKIIKNYYMMVVYLIVIILIIEKYCFGVARFVRINIECIKYIERHYLSP